jgi:hypothetical protein
MSLSTATSSIVSARSRFRRAFSNSSALSFCASDTLIPPNLALYLYKVASEIPRLAPVYDLVTTTAYLPMDQMALTLDGSTRWPTIQKLKELGQRRAGLTARQATEQIEATAATLLDLRAELASWFKASSNPEIGAAMVARWEAWAESISCRLSVSNVILPRLFASGSCALWAEVHS